MINRGCESRGRIQPRAASGPDEKPRALSNGETEAREQGAGAIKAGAGAANGHNRWHPAAACVCVSTRVCVRVLRLCCWM